MSPRWVLTTLCLCLLAWAAPAAQAASTWLPAQTVSSPANAPAGIQPVVKMGPSGDIAAVWVGGSIVFADVRQVGATAFTQETVSTPGDVASTPTAAVNASGTVVVAWIDETAEQYEIAIRPPGGVFSGPVKAGTTGGNLQQSLSVAIDDAGDVLLGESYSTAGHSIAAYAWQPAGGTLTVAPISEPTSQAYAPVVAMDRAGDAVLAWEDRLGATHTVVRAMTRPAAGAFGSAQSLSNSSEYGFAITAAIGATGQAAVAWQYGSTAPPYRIEASTSTGPNEPLSAPQIVSPAAGNDEYPAIGVGGDGKVVATWEQYAATNAEDAASASAGGTFAAAIEISTNGSVGYPQLAMDSAGDAVIAWSIYAEGEGGTEAVTLAANGGLEPETLLSAAGEKVDYFISSNRPAVSVGMDSAGEALTSWERNSEHTIQARIYQPTSPTLAPSPTPTHPPLVTCPVESVPLRTSPLGLSIAPVCGGPLRAVRECVAPRLSGLSLTAAKRRLVSARCTLGKVRTAKRYKHAKRLVVAAQSAKAGTNLPFAASVSLTLKPAPRHKQNRRQRHPHRH